jgi:hypothetical protein
MMPSSPFFVSSRRDPAFVCAFDHAFGYIASRAFGVLGVRYH